MSDRKITPDIPGDPAQAQPVVKPLGAEYISLADIQTDGGTQMRANLNDDTVQEYVAAFTSSEDWPFPPVITFHDGETHWLADGFHRVSAARIYAERNHIDKAVPAQVSAGTRRDAILYAAGANARHGLRRTHNDKLRAVETLLRDPEWSQWSKREISRRCNVSDTFVADVLKAMDLVLTAVNRSENVQYTTRHGTVATMQTANIGAKPPASGSTISPLVDSHLTLGTVKAMYESRVRQWLAESPHNLNNLLSWETYEQIVNGPLCAWLKTAYGHEPSMTIVSIVRDIQNDQPASAAAPAPVTERLVRTEAAAEPTEPVPSTLLLAEQYLRSLLAQSGKHTLGLLLSVDRGFSIDMGPYYPTLPAAVDALLATAKPPAPAPALTLPAWQDGWDEEDEGEWIIAGALPFWTIDDFSRPRVILRKLAEQTKPELIACLTKRYRQLDQPIPIGSRLCSTQ